MRLPNRRWLNQWLETERRSPEPEQVVGVPFEVLSVPPAEMSPPLDGVAIVAEGGGQRGIFTAGVLDVFLEQRFNPFSIGVGVSAGAQNLLTYFLGEQGYARRAIAELTMDPAFFIPYRWLFNRSIIDLDQYFSRTLDDSQYQLPYRRLDDVAAKRRLQFVATRRDTLAPVYLEPDADTAMLWLKASSAVPLLYKPGVPYAGTVLIDGGVADPLPVRHAWELGARYVVLIRTLPEEVNWSSWRERIDSLGARQMLPGSVLTLLAEHEARYQEGIGFLNSPPPGLQVHTISPEHKLGSFAFGSNAEALQRDYVTGRVSGLAALAYLRKVLTGTTEPGLQ